jgi:hypothetical protein
LQIWVPVTAHTNRSASCDTRRPAGTDTWPLNNPGFRSWLWKLSVADKVIVDCGFEHRDILQLSPVSTAARKLQLMASIRNPLAGTLETRFSNSVEPQTDH